MTYLLFVVWLSTSAADLHLFKAEFDDRQACENALAFVQQQRGQSVVRARCLPKAGERTGLDIQPPTPR